jgi:RHS repeat-associated protein
LGCPAYTYYPVSEPKIKRFKKELTFAESEKTAQIVYLYGFIGAENDNELSGTGNSQNHEFRQYNPRLGRYMSVDPLAASFPWNSPYAYAENRVIDGLDLEGREYISFHHYANGGVAKTEFYKMTDKDIKRLGGTTAGIHNSVPYGPGGKGVVHYYYDEKGNRSQTLWEMRQTGGASDFKYHGLYSGPGSITHDGKPNSTNYDFNEQPIDWADAIAKRHDEDYAAVAGENYVGFLDDVRTVQADRDMVARIDKITAAFLNPFKANTVEGVETPVRTSYSTEMDFTLLGQRIIISSLATYKQWKIDNNLGNDSKYKDNREAFGKAHPATAKILDQTQE